MDNNKESHMVGKPEKDRNDSLIEALESDYELNKSRLQRLEWKSLLKLLKENFGLILFFIYGLGAFIQALELSRIDLSYLRFFSVTQLASDGALVSVTLALFIIIGWSYYFCVNLRFKENSKYLINIEKSKSTPIVKPLLILLIILIDIYVLFLENIFVEEYKKHPFISLIFLSLCVALLAHFIKFSKNIIKHSDNLKSPKNQKEKLSKILLIFISILSYVFIPIISIKTLIMYSLLLREPRNFENYNKVGLTIEEQHKDISDFKILYFNDKYTFIELNREDSNKDTVEVYKTDAILFDETVIKVID